MSAVFKDKNDPLLLALREWRAATESLVLEVIASIIARLSPEPGTDPAPFRSPQSPS